METKNMNQKNLISIFLLVVGVIFILVAGGIFVTTAWVYLPVIVKQMALLVVAAGLFGTSVIIGKNEKLTWIADVLFHLGNAFIGFFVIAIMGGLLVNDRNMAFFRILLASGAMLVPTAIRLLAKKTGVDLIATSLLADVVIFSGCVAFEATYTGYLLCMTVFIAAMTVLDCTIAKNKVQERIFAITSTTMTVLHIVGYSVIAWIGLCADDLSMAATIIVAIALLLMTGFEYVTRENIAYRVWNSVNAIALSFVVVARVTNFLGLQDGFSVVCILAIFISVIGMVATRRKEWIGIMVAFAVAIPYGQLFCYWLDSLTFFGGSIEGWSVTYNPYSFVIALGFVALYVVENGAKALKSWLESKTLSFTGMQLIKVVMLWFASKSTDCLGMVFFLFGVLDWLAIAVVTKNEIAKKGFASLAIFPFVAAIAVQPFIEIPDRFVVEWVCFVITIGVVLFRGIWWNVKEKLSILYFIIACLELVMLLCNNIYRESLGNLMFLGVVGITMLVYAAVRNNKKYVIASSTTLILLVFYLTREFWLSIAWWVYLFVAGVVLVLLAIKKAKEM